MTVYFDMDGTIADLYSVPNWLARLRSEDAGVYAEATPMGNMAEIQTKMEHLQFLGIKVGIISWCSKQATKEYAAEIRKVKKAWLKENFPGFHFDEMHIVAYGRKKVALAKDDGWLIDDEKGNRENWNEKKVGSFNPLEVSIPDILDEILSLF